MWISAGTYNSEPQRGDKPGVGSFPLGPFLTHPSCCVLHSGPELTVYSAPAERTPKLLPPEEIITKWCLIVWHLSWQRGGFQVQPKRRADGCQVTDFSPIGADHMVLFSDCGWHFNLKFCTKAQGDLGHGEIWVDSVPACEELKHISLSA